ERPHEVVPARQRLSDTGGGARVRLEDVRRRGCPRIPHDPIDEIIADVESSELVQRQFVARAEADDLAFDSRVKGGQRRGKSGLHVYSAGNRKIGRSRASQPASSPRVMPVSVSTR